MIVVTVELWPFGFEDRKELLGRATIVNDASSDSVAVGNYDVQFSTRGGRRVWREGRVEGFPRQRLLAWDLLYRALKEIVGDR